MGLISLMGNVKAQHDSIPESNPVILQRIDEWQDLKFGFMMHWGIYAQWGIVESWNICNEPTTRTTNAPIGPSTRPSIHSILTPTVGLPLPKGRA